MAPCGPTYRSHPNGEAASTLTRAVTAAGELGVELLTVHAGGGRAMLKAAAGATLDGKQVTVKAGAKLSATASGTAELKSTGILTVKGSLVKIN